MSQNSFLCCSGGIQKRARLRLRLLYPLAAGHFPTSGQASKKLQRTKQPEHSELLCCSATFATMNSICKPLPLLKYPATIRVIAVQRLYATQTGLGTSNATPRPRRKAVTPFNDDGRVSWGDLTAGEKAARTTQQTFNFGMILLGAVLTVGGPV